MAPRYAAFARRLPLLLASAAFACLARPARAADDDTLAHGRYVATAADCIACHTAPDGKPFAGGLPLKTPFGTIYSTNITPSSSGIGGYSEAQFARAVRQGLRADGANLYPAMPYTEYSGITDPDMHALYVYFRKGVAPVTSTTPRDSLRFPFNIRLLLKPWNALFAGGKPFQPLGARDAAWNRGKYLVDVLGHCGTCHTPRSLLMAEKTSKGLSGASLGAWYAPNITPGPAGIGSWSIDEVTAYLATGTAPHGAYAGGEMLEAIDHSFSKLTDADRRAIAIYLRTVPAIGTAVPAIGTVSLPADPLFSPSARETDPRKMDGAALYQAFCATCHGDRGQGDRATRLPAMHGNRAFLRPTPDNLIAAVLQGLWPQRPTMQAMPGFARRLTDAQAARLVDYLTATFGDPKQTTTPEHVGTLRKALNLKDAAR